MAVIVPTRRRTSADPFPELSDAVSVTRFWQLVSIRGADECWPWNGYRDENGYGIFNWRGRRHGAHELALSFSTGESRHPDLDTCHACDSPPCCNPNHLRFDTRKSNVADMVARDRANNTAKLTDDQIRLIRERRALGARQTDLAEQFNCSPAYVSAIVRGRVRINAGGPIEKTRKYVNGK